ncbi:MAG TPA: alpha/beta hydrolase [Ferruginibacter sp.]|nr:alpha/beta hydrolase [Chitinophagaceae bacterium]HRI26290.1 alpha/beta hydrolase [Ferruginibacter sp.]
MTPKNSAYQNATIFYRMVGKGKPVVLIHGFGEDGNIWDKQVAFLKDHFRLIIPDLPGSGRSALIPDMSIEGMAEAMHSMLMNEGISACVVLGHSMGGYLTLAMAEKYPDLFRSFGLIHSSAFADSEEKKAARSKSIEFIKNNGAYEFLRTAIPGLFSKTWSESHTEEIDSLIEKGRNFSDEALVAYYQAMINRPDRTHILRSFSKPILFIIGQYDNAVPFAHSMQQCYLPVESHIHILRNSAHMGMWEETHALNNFLLGFLQ